MCYYKIYVVDILIIFNSDRINEERLLLAIKKLGEKQTFKLTLENNNKINFIELTISRREKKLKLGV